MKEVYKVVILLDLDLVSSFDGDSDSFQSKVKCLRRTVLNVLTVFSIQHTDLLNQNSDPQFRWGCKFYCSTQKKKASQRYQFTDFNLEVLKNFERELEEQCRNRRLDLLTERTKKSSGSNQHCEKVPVEHGQYHAHILGTALKDILCDYPWNEQQIDSPVRGSASNAHLRRTNGKNHVGSLKIGTDEESNKNFVVVISSVPKSADSLHRFLGDDLKIFDSGSFLNSILPDSVRNQFYNIARISLLWLDLTLAESHDATDQKYSLVDYTKLIDGALKSVGGGLIPLNSSLEFLMSREEKWSSCCCNKSSFPKVMECCSPFTSAMSGFLTKTTMEKQFSSRHYQSVLHIEGIDTKVTYDLDLMPLFGKSMRTGSKIEKKENYFSSTNGDEDEMFWFPRNLHTIGTISIHDIHNQLIARPFLFICNGMKDFKNEPSSFHHLLVELVNQQQALLVSCENICQGILFPANSRAKVAMLYILTDGETISSITSKLGEVTKSPSAETNDFVQHLLSDWEPSRPHTLKENKALQNQDESVLLVPVQREKLSISNCNFKNTSIADEERSIDEIKLDEKLQEAYRTEEKPAKLASDESLKICENVSPFANDCDAVGNSDVIVHDTPASDKDAQDSTENKNAVNNDNGEEQLVQKLKVLYELAVQNCEYTKYAELLVGAVIAHYRKACITECPKSMAEKLICQHFLVTPGTLAKKYATLSSESKKARVSEHFMQTVLNLEILSIVSPALTVDVNDISAHLRMVSFVFGVNEMTNFLRFTVVEHYYLAVKDVVIRLCQDLNQPVFGPNQQDDRHSADSETDHVSSPDKFDNMSLTDISAPSSVTSCSSQPNSKRAERFVRNPSFNSSKSSRQIFVPTKKLRKLKAAIKKSSVSSTSNKEKQNNKDGTASKQQSKEKTQPPTTPQGRHVLRTKKAAETPVYKQVDNSVVRRQSLKRKRAREELEDDSSTVEETPDKKSDWIKKFWVRRSPRMHACTIVRDNNTLHVLENVTELKLSMTSDTDQFGNIRTSEVFEKESNKIANDKDNTPKQLTTGTTSGQVKVLAITPERKARVRRHLNLSGLLSPPEKPSDKLEIGVSKLNDEQRLKFSAESAGGRLLRSKQRGNFPNLRSFSVSDIQSASCTDNATFEQYQIERNKSCKQSQVSKQLLQTPVKSDKLNDNAVDAISETNACQETDTDSTVIAGTPTRNGVDSPITLFEDLCLLYGSLTNGLEESLSRSSSPRIPLLFDEDGAVIDDCVLNRIEDVDKSSFQQSTCDNVFSQSQKASLNQDQNSQTLTPTADRNQNVVIESPQETKVVDHSLASEAKVGEKRRRTRSISRLSFSEDKEINILGAEIVQTSNDSDKSDSKSEMTQRKCKVTKIRRTPLRECQPEKASPTATTLTKPDFVKISRKCQTLKKSRELARLKIDFNVKSGHNEVSPIQTSNSRRKSLTSPLKQLQTLKSDVLEDVTMTKNAQTASSKSPVTPDSFSLRRTRSSGKLASSEVPIEISKLYSAKRLPKSKSDIAFGASTRDFNKSDSNTPVARTETGKRLNLEGKVINQQMPTAKFSSSLAKNKKNCIHSAGRLNAKFSSQLPFRNCRSSTDLTSLSASVELESNSKSSIGQCNIANNSNTSRRITRHKSNEKTDNNERDTIKSLELETKKKLFDVITRNSFKMPSNKSTPETDKKIKCKIIIDDENNIKFVASKSQSSSSQTAKPNAQSNSSSNLKVETQSNESFGATPNDPLAPQRFTRLASKEIGLTLDAFTEISTIPSASPIKAVVKLTKRYGTLPSQLINKDNNNTLRSTNIKRHKWMFGKRKLVLSSSSKTKSSDSKDRPGKKLVSSKHQGSMPVSITQFCNTRQPRSAALIKNSVRFLRQLRSSAVCSSETRVTRNKV